MDNNNNSGTGAAAESGAMLEINIRTLGSSTYTLRVDKNIPVPALKEKLATLVGVPIQEQRLIYRGRVLRDDQILSAYDVDDGHTLHLVPREARDTQQRQNQADPQADTQQGRPAQVTHSLLLGTINIPTPTDGSMPDFNRIVSAVLSSINGNGGPQPQGGQQPQRQGMATLGLNQLFARSFEIPCDSLTTMSTYLSRMEQMLAMSGYGSPAPEPAPQAVSQSQEGSAQSGSAPSFQSSAPSGPAPTEGSTPPAASMRALMTPTALAAIIRRVQALLSNQISSLLTGLAGQLENEPSTVEVPMRAEMQVGALWAANVVQQLGSLLLELGRATSTMHLGYAPAEAVVNAGPAVYISQNGPNPLMVQPSSVQPLGAFIPRLSNTGTGTAEGSQALQGSAVLQETIMVIQDNGEPHVNPSGQQAPAPSADGNVNQAHLAQVAQAVERLLPGLTNISAAPIVRPPGASLGVPVATFQQAVQARSPNAPQHASQTGTPPASNTAIIGASQGSTQNVPQQPSQTNATTDLEDSQPTAPAASQQEQEASRVSSPPTSQPSSSGETAGDHPIGLGLQPPLAARPRRRSSAPRQSAPPQQPQPGRNAAQQIGNAAQLPNLLSNVLRSPAFGAIAQEVMQSAAPGDNSDPANIVLQQALPSVLRALGGAPPPPTSANTATPSQGVATDAFEGGEAAKVENAVKQLENADNPQTVLRGVADAAGQGAALDSTSSQDILASIQPLAQEYLAVLLQDLGRT